ncbi:ATP-binding protein [Streptosporangium sp. NPDC006007]|uniref:ATP-binding protein n=1 Tax=Streptosporangium sp. NPDC006007 TaxID=3154575 RepID=UPI0033B2E1BA
MRSGRPAQGGERRIRLHTLHQRDFPGLPRSAGTVRGWTAELLAGQVAAETLETVTLLVSELVANAVVHSDSSLPGGTLTVCLGIGDGVLHVEVIDDGSATSVPTMRTTDDDSDGGRGLSWVDLLADVWGTDRDDEAGNAVWFQITSAGRDTPAKQDSSARRTPMTAVTDAGRRDRVE